MKNGLTLLAISLLIAAACASNDSSENDPPFTVTCDPDTDINYTTEIVPLINAKCAIEGCHGDQPGIPDWTQHAELADHGEEIQRRITLPLSDADHMPRSGSITQQQRETLYCWIEKGAPD